jgi:crotonobetainyl-CoA:carnitine CoA-transferase CaiB-like acyl-CoA transferase
VSGPLEGVRVLDLSRLLPGAFATALLGDLGAEVIKVEQPGVGDPMRAYEPKIGEASSFTWITDRNKRSIVVDLRDPRGVDVVLRVAASCDLAVEGFRPGVADRLGVGYDALHAANPAIVLCSLSGFGADGPVAQDAAHDINYISRAGILSVNGIDGRLAIPGVQLGDLAGALHGVAGLLAALYAAERTGAGDHVDVGLADGAFALHSAQLGPHFATGEVPGAGDGMLTGAFPCYQVYTCADGLLLAVGALEPHFFVNLCAAVGRPDLAATHSDPSALPAWRALFAARPRARWLELLEGADACTGLVNDVAAAVADPQLRHREMIVELEHPTAGPHLQIGTPIKLRERPGGVQRPAPALGADTVAVLTEAGLTPSYVDDLLAAGVVAAAHDRSPA